MIKYTVVHTNNEWMITKGKQYLVVDINGNVKWKYEKNVTIDDTVAWSTLTEAMQNLIEVLAT
jgi:hypothetical protein